MFKQWRKNPIIKSLFNQWRKNPITKLVIYYNTCILATIYVIEYPCIQRQENLDIRWLFLRRFSTRDFVILSRTNWGKATECKKSYDNLRKATIHDETYDIRQSSLFFKMLLRHIRRCKSLLNMIFVKNRLRLFLGPYWVLLCYMYMYSVL